MASRSLSLAVVAVAAVLVTGCSGTGPAERDPAVDLAVDADRDGTITAADSAAEDRASALTGALLLPNLDDDSRRCSADVRRILAGSPTRADENELHGCNDAADDVVNGPADAADLAPIQLDATDRAPSVWSSRRSAGSGSSRRAPTASGRSPMGPWSPGMPGWPSRPSISSATTTSGTGRSPSPRPVPGVAPIR